MSGIDELLKTGPQLVAHLKKNSCADCHLPLYVEGLLRHIASLNETIANTPSTPALPAEVEAVVANILDFCREHEAGLPTRHTIIWAITNANGTFSISREQLREAATLLRRYAQAVAENDAEIARLRGVVRRGRDKISDLIDANLGADDKQTGKRLAAQHIATAMKDSGLCEWAQIIGETAREGG